MRPKKYFIGLRNPQHQQQNFMCIPACIKTILDNQFNLPHRISLRAVIASICNELPHDVYPRSREFIPKGTDEIIDSLKKLLKDYDMVPVEKVNFSKDGLLDLIASNIYPMIYLDLEEYYEYRGTKIRTKSDTFLYHSILVIGYDEDKEIFGLWDPLDSHEKKSYSFNEVRKIDYKTFLSCWDKIKSRVIYLFEKSKQKKLLYFSNI